MEDMTSSTLSQLVNMEDGSFIPVRTYLAGFFIGILTVTIPLLCVILL